MMERNRTEKLTLIFTLKNPNPMDSAEIIAGSDKIKFQPRKGIIGALDVFDMLIKIMHSLEIEVSFTDGRKKTSATILRRQIERKNAWGHLETDEISFRYGVAGSYNHCFISIREKVPGAADDWDVWTKPFIVLDGFVEGWVADVEYSYWQNVRDPIEYKNVGLDFSHLPMKSNGLPPPLEKMEIDISCNPGRWVLQSGYVEAVGFIMWLSDLFWNKVGMTHKNRVSSVDWLRTSELEKGILKIQMPEPFFISDKTADAQNRLRTYLYGQVL